MKTILFQGDSITDCYRTKENDLHNGTGYATRVSAQLSYDFPGEYKLLNRGISGNRITDLYSRIKIDIINLKPDYISILIGVNDVWHEVGHKNGVAAEKFEKIYNMLIEEIKEELPDVKIMILEPFVLKSTATEEEWDTFRTETEKRAQAAKRVAEKHNLVFVPLQEKFDEMAAKQPEPYWTWEGVHPSAAGHELIARKWLEGFKELNK
ncbi:MAG: SGNH/GDSL hydrolase family protein [Clostridia bacterium]|nr:SGNH/GDSL hydrolase family protein [Clostridia bacterium]